MGFPIDSAAVAMFSRTFPPSSQSHRIDSPLGCNRHVPSFVEYGEYPYVTSDVIKKALRLKRSLFRHARSEAVAADGWPTVTRNLGVLSVVDHAQYRSCGARLVGGRV